MAGVGVARWKAWPAVEKCFLKSSIIVELSVVTELPILSAVGHSVLAIPGKRDVAC